MLSIFDKQRLSATQLRTVADRRFADALYLLNSKQNKYANGAMYLGGFVIECLLKAKLIEQYRWLGGNVDLAKRTKADQEIFALCYRFHDLEGILDRLPTLKRDQFPLNDLNRLGNMLQRITSEWTIFARYSTHSADIGTAHEFLDDVGELKRWLR